ncbi:MAG: class I SAM-dependent methyltransferase [Cellulomonas sp.]|nr:class I SAM-dependent methyltransferase [Cellulomonas sp.]MCR6648032.1 class I SAM-dependent methyltransferase [Cellulomonas sp.]
MQRRLLVMVAGVGLVVAVGLLGAVAGWGRLVDAVLVALAGAGVVLLLDLRRRAGESGVLFRRAAERDRELARQVGGVVRTVAAMKGSAGLEARLLDALKPLATTLGEFDERIAAPVQRALGPDGQMEQMERRVFGSFEAERLRAADRHREVLTAVTDTGQDVRELKKSVTAGHKRVVTDLTAVSRDETRQVEALLQIIPGLEERRALLPPTGRWAMDARSVAHLLDLVRAQRPGLVVELGSGTSSVWLGYELTRIGGRLTSVDHDEVFAGLTREALTRHGLTEVAEVRVAPLTDLDDSVWYDRDALADLDAIDLLIVDGPPGSLGERVRSAAMPFFAERLAPGALVLLDDSDRPDEAAIAQEWAEEFGLERIETGVSRLAVLRRPAR